MAAKSERPSLIGEDEVAARAYQLWVRRGCPDGSPEEDWFAARRELESARKRAVPVIPAPETGGALLHG